MKHSVKCNSSVLKRKMKPFVIERDFEEHFGTILQNYCLSGGAEWSLVNKETNTRPNNL